MTAMKLQKINKTYYVAQNTEKMDHYANRQRILRDILEQVRSGGQISPAIAKIEKLYQPSTNDEE
jgi:2-polyprenyl-3-methyl-5-hydroxy-6-metoxy-1,4-benzoquinol methylase